MAASSDAVFINVLATAVTAAKEAGEVIRQVMTSGNLEIVLKGVNDPQTAADRSAQVTIYSILHNRFPKLTLIGEEGDIERTDVNISDSSPCQTVLKDPCPAYLKDVKDEDIVVWVDPLDGTTEFTKGLLENVTVLIGLAVNGRAVGGVIYQPYYNASDNNDTEKKLGRCIWGTVGGNLGGLMINQIKNQRDDLILTTTRSHSNKLVEAAIVALNASQVLRVGGAGYKVLLLLEGKADCYVFPTPGCKRWDTCAPEAILTAAGGVLTDTSGNKYSYVKDTPFVNTGGVLAALDPTIHKRCLDVLQATSEST